MIALSLVVKATIVLVAGLTAVRLCRRAPASVRHVILACTFGALIGMPLTEILIPPASFAVPIDVPAVRGLLTPQPTTELVAGDTMARGAAERSVSNVGMPSVGEAILGVWAIGAAVLIGSLLHALGRLRRLTRRALPWLDARPLVDALAVEAGLTRSVDALLHEDIAVPLTWGLGRPVILLPMEAREWSDADLRHALLHEMEHVYRNDWIGQLVARTVRALYWFHPLAWTAMRQLSLEAERACDDAVIRTADRTAYADQLVTLAQRLRDVPQQVVPAMACRSDLSTRVRALLDERQRRGRAHWLPHAVAIAVTCAMVSTIGPVQAVERTPVRRLGPELHPAPWAGVLQALSLSKGSGRLGVALIEAAEEGDLDDVSGLIAAGVDVNSVALGDGSPLIAAARAGHPRVVHLLLDHGADVDLGVPGDGNPLIMAAREGHTDVVELLLSRGASIDMVVDGDENALIQASGEGRLTVVRALVGRGADVNARVWATRGEDRRDGEWRTPLNMAIRGRHNTVVDFLRSVGAQQ